MTISNDKICILCFPEEFKEWIDKSLGPNGCLARTPELDIPPDEDGVATETYIVGLNNKENKE